MPLSAQVARPAPATTAATVRPLETLRPASSPIWGSFVGGAAPRLRTSPTSALLAGPVSARHSLLPPVAASISPDGTFDVDKLDVDNLDLSDPFGCVGDVMTSENLRCVTPEDPLTAAAAKLDKITGLAVVDGENVVVGVVSIKDINRLRKQRADLSVPVKQHMSTPPIVVRERTRIGEAAALMLARNIHRLPVVDPAGKLIGIVSRTDIFQPLLNPKEDVYKALNVVKDASHREALLRSLDEAAAETAAAAAAAATPLGSTGGSGTMSLDGGSIDDTYQIKYLYDGECEMCRQLMGTLKSKDNGRGIIKFVNIASMGYDPRSNEGITFEEAMETIHAIRRDGTIVTGPDALRALYESVGWGWIATVMSLPVVESFVEALYQIISKYRLPLSGTLTAMRRVSLTDSGVEHCVDDEEECGNVSW